MNFLRIAIATAAAASVAGLHAASLPAMVDPRIDAPGPFTYLAKSSTELGVMGGPRATQVTFDGSFYTRSSELCFFHGSPLRPMMARQKVLADGWLPVVKYGWKDGPIHGCVEAFAATLDGKSSSPLVNFVRVRLTNTGRLPATAHFASATRFSGRDHRFEERQPFAFSPDWRYEMTADSLVRDNRLVLLYPPGGTREPIPGEPYTNPFNGGDYAITPQAEVGMVRYELVLRPGAAVTLDFKLPLLPVPSSDTEFINAVRAAGYDDYRHRTVTFWRAELGSGTQISVPERKVDDTVRADIVYDLIALENRNGQWIQHVNKFQYDWFWLRDAAYIIHAYDDYGYHAIAKNALDYVQTFQQPNGLFRSQPGQLDGFGQALFALGQHYFLTGNLAYAKSVYHYFPPAMAWLKRTRAADAYHLMPPTAAHDNENIDGRYTGHNFWALLGARTAVRMARATGHAADARDFLAQYDDYYAAFMKRLAQVSGKDGYIPPGLDVQGGQDWGNLLGLYPSEVLSPMDPRVTATLRKIHRDKYQEGVMTYEGKIHQYLTVKATQNHVFRDEQEQTLQDFYHILLHTGSTQEGFEWSATPWGDRDVGGNYPPHGWGAAMINLLLRNMLVNERGGNGGLGPRDLHLFTAVSPAWAIPGREVAIRNAPTEAGTVSAAMRFTRTGAVVTLAKKYRIQPNSIVLHIPYFVTLKSLRTDARTSRRTANAIVFSPDVSTVTLIWTRRKVEPLSYAKVVAAYKREYARRYRLYTAAGNKPLAVEPPPLITAAQRRAATEPGIAVGKPVTTNGGTETGHNPELAVDGNATDPDGSSWFAGPPTPRWLQVDLGAPTLINRVRVFPYWDGSRSYQYTVEASEDGNAWKTVADRSRNTDPATELGDPFTFQPVAARYVRVTMLHNTANESVHLVELRVFAAKTGQ